MSSGYREPTWKEVAALDQPGRHRVGKNLYLQITKAGARSYLFRYKLAFPGAKQREMGLGSFKELSLAAAREEAERFRKLVREGVDPIEHRRREREDAARAAAARKTFKEVAESFLENNEGEWRNPKHRQQWRNTLATYAYPHIGDLFVNEITRAHIFDLLQPIWTTKQETASRVRGRIERILDAARAEELYEGENPARWRGNLSARLPSPKKAHAVRHHPALPYDDLPAFMTELRKREGWSALALEFLILTAARSGEVRGARWEEFDLQRGEWIVPADRMKAGRAHRVPLSTTAQDIVSRLQNVRTGAFVFPAPQGGQFSDAALSALLRRMKRDTITVHGFRSTFRDWAAEQTSFPPEVAERALAHVNRDKVEAAYQRSDLFEKRRALMEAWASYCNGEAGALRLVG
jgi:integrase